MSRPRLHDKLQELFASRSPALLDECLNHPDFDLFKLTYGITVPTTELVRAFTHTSFAHEYEVPHQELLEFLGDSVLQLLLTDELFRRFPLEKEGRLSKLRSALVNEENLALLATSLNLGSLLLVGKGEFKKQLFGQPAVLADTVEALLAQVYRHQGYEATRELFFQWLGQFVPRAFEENFLEGHDAKSKLQELTLARFKSLPRYTASEVNGGFEVQLWINEELKVAGFYASKKSGERDLAEQAIKQKLI